VRNGQPHVNVLGGSCGRLHRPVHRSDDPSRSRAPWPACQAPSVAPEAGGGRKVAAVNPPSDKTAEWQGGASGRGIGVSNPAVNALSARGEFPGNTSTGKCGLSRDVARTCNQLMQERSQLLYSIFVPGMGPNCTRQARLSRRTKMVKWQFEGAGARSASLRPVSQGGGGTRDRDAQRTPPVQPVLRPSEKSPACSSLRNTSSVGDLYWQHPTPRSRDRRSCGPLLRTSSILTS